MGKKSIWQDPAEKLFCAEASSDTRIDSVCIGEHGSLAKSPFAEFESN